MSLGNSRGRCPPNTSTTHPPEPPRRVVPRPNPGAGTNASTHQQPQRHFPQPSIREIHKNAWLKRQCLDKKGGPFLKKSERFWVVFCVHDDLEGWLEFYTEPKMGQLHKPIEAISLNSCCHVSPSIIGEDNEYEFAVTLPSQVIRLAAANWDQMMEWVESLQFKLREMHVISPKDNLYSKLPETKSTGIVQTNTISTFRDPNSPLPPPPEILHDYIPLLSRPIPTPRNFDHEYGTERVSNQNGLSELASEFNRNCTLGNVPLYIHPCTTSEGSSNENSNSSGLSFESTDIFSSGMEIGSSNESLLPCSSRSSGEVCISIPLDISKNASKSESTHSSVELCSNGHGPLILPQIPSQPISKGTITTTAMKPPITKRTLNLTSNKTMASSFKNDNDSRNQDLTTLTNRCDVGIPTTNNLYEPIFTTSLPSTSTVSSNIKLDSTRPPEIPIKKKFLRDNYVPLLNESVQRSSSTSRTSEEFVESHVKDKLASKPYHRRTQSTSSSVPDPSNSSGNIRNPFDNATNLRDAEFNQLTKPTSQNSSISDNQVIPQQASNGSNHVSLKEQQVLRLKSEMDCTSGIRTVLRKKDCVGSIAFVDYLGAVWIGGWNQVKHPVLYYAFHVGDQVLKVDSSPVQNSAEAIQAITISSSTQVEFTIRRLPYGNIFLLKREKEGDLLGLSSVGKGYGSEIYVHPEGSAARQGVSNSATACDGVSSCHWSLTEINGRPLSLICKEIEVKDRLNAVGKEITILVQPSDLVKHLRKQIKSMKNFKDYILS